MLSRLEKTAVAVVAGIGLLVLVVGVVAVAKREEIRAWLDAPAVLGAEATVRDLDLPASFDDDATNSACDLAGSRCAWTALPPDEAVAQLATALVDAELAVAEVTCEEAELPVLAGAGRPVCGAVASLSGADLWAVATDRAPLGDVPFGRTAAWYQWDAGSMSQPLLGRLGDAAGWPTGEPVPVTAEQVAGLLPERLAPVVGEPCWNEANGVCAGWHGVIDVLDLEPDVLPGLVAELVEAGFYLPRADLAGGGISVQAHRRLEPGSWTGAFVVIREVDGQVVADAFGL